MRITYAGNVYVGDSADSLSTLNVWGNIISYGDQTMGSPSDARLKENIESITADHARKVLSGLRGVSFDWNAKAIDFDDRKGIRSHDIGFLAQEVLSIVPEAVTKDYMGDYYRLDKGKIVPFLVCGWQDHETRIAAMERENRELREEIKRLRS